MKLIRVIAGLTVALSLSACASTEFTMRNAPFETLPDDAITQPTAVPAPEMPITTASNFKIVNHAIRVPEDLRVSEANLYYPFADIVWRGDPFGDRREQIASIFSESVKRANLDAQGTTPARMEITLNRFHSITEKTRYTVGGTHAISFFVTLRDPQTGAILAAPWKVKANLKAFGGRRAIEADKQGLGMKERIQRHLARVLAAELAQPGGGGWKDMDNRLADAVDQI
ncbi:MAG: hypothetical protein QNJ09_09520 [Paracoccaceae bacterium]|nr:hypothetical protein [Paracoccaceae bacterium]